MPTVYFFEKYNINTNGKDRSLRPATMAFIERFGCEPLHDTAHEVADDLIDLDGRVVDCRCANVRHDEHAGRSCGAYASESDGLCKACHDHAASEWFRATPDLPIMPPR